MNKQKSNVQPRRFWHFERRSGGKGVKGSGSGFDEGPRWAAAAVRVPGGDA